MPNTQFECPRCYKRCGDVGTLKMHMKIHEKTEPKSGSMLKWVVKRIKSERKPKPKIAIELKPIVKPGIWNFENQLLKKKLLFQIPFVRDRPAYIVGRNNRHLIPTHLWIPWRWPILILTSNHPNFNFPNVFYRISKQNFPWRKSFLSSKKAIQALNFQ